MAAGPVPGMVKFSIWQAKMKAPRTPMSGTSRTSFSCLTLRAQSAVIAAEAAPHGAAYRR